MSRLPTIPVENWPADLVELWQAADMTRTERGAGVIFVHNPEVLKALVVFMSALVGNTTLRPRLQELVRLRLGYLNQCGICMYMRYKTARDDGFTEDLVRQLEHPQDAVDFTEAEKLALAYVDQTVEDHKTISQDTFDNLRKVFTDAEIVELSSLIAFYDGFSRLEAIFDPVEILPESYGDASVEHAPWRNEWELVRR